MCFEDCFYENEKSECTIIGFKKPKNGNCKGQLRCIACADTIMTKDEYNKGIEICKDCTELMLAIHKGFN